MDTDGDTIPDSLDTDSDNDNCPDAVEGGDDILQSDLNSDDELENINTETGLSNDVSTSGQTIGGSQQAVQVSLTQSPVNLIIENGQSATFTAVAEALIANSFDSNGDPIFNTATTDDSGNVSYEWFLSSNLNTVLSTSGNLTINSSDANYVDGNIFTLIVSHPGNPVSYTHLTLPTIYSV